MAEKKITNNWVVKCPHCGAEYHLTEIALPGELIGSPKSNGIIKDCTGKILYIDWAEEPTTTFEYSCDNCAKDFLVEVVISAKAVAKPEAEDFSTLETSLI